MKKFNKNLIVFVLAFALVLGFTGPNTAHAATSPTLGASSIFSVLGGAAVTNTGTTNTDGAVGVSPGTSISGGTINATGGIHSNDSSAIAAQADLTTAVTGLWTTLDQGCTSTYVVPTDLTTLSPLAPGVYCSTSSFSLSGNLNLIGAGPWIFKTGTTLITSSASSITVATGSACDVWWRVGSAATLGTTTAFIGNIIIANTASVSTMNTGATLNGRLLAQAAATVALQGNTITAPICTAPTPPVVRRSSSGSSPRITQPTSNPALLTIIKQVVNNGGSTATASLFNLHVKNSGVDVLGSPNKGVTAPGIYYSLPVGTYVISEDSNPSYARTFSGDCDLNGSVTLSASQNKTCVVTNTHILVPSLPKTGFPPQESGTWYESLLNNILNLFR